LEIVNAVKQSTLGNLEKYGKVLGKEDKFNDPILVPIILDSKFIGTG
jgi:hypothetical protein